MVLAVACNFLLVLRRFLRGAVFFASSWSLKPFFLVTSLWSLRPRVTSSWSFATPSWPELVLRLHPGPSPSWCVFPALYCFGLSFESDPRAQTSPGFPFQQSPCRRLPSAANLYFDLETSPPLWALAGLRGSSPTRLRPVYSLCLTGIPLILIFEPPSMGIPFPSLRPNCVSCVMQQEAACA